MPESIVANIVIVIVLGIGAQWLAWRIHLPSILLLLTVGFVAGPVTGILPPSALHGEWVFAFVSLSIGIILFEGGLNLRRSELIEVGPTALRLITVGVLITWVLGSAAAYYIFDLSLGMSIQLGAILTVTGPTVVIPMLRHVRPKGRIEAIAKWEGITIDPVGAILSVLVLEAILVVKSLEAQGAAVEFSELIVPALEGLISTIIVAVGISTIGAAVLIFLLYRRLVPDHLQSPVALMIVVGTLALSNAIRPEAGLLEATLLGVMLANQKWVQVKRISEFKENLQVLLIACLFIVLSARLDISTIEFVDARTVIFLAALILFIRPVSVFLSCMKTGLENREKVFLSWLAPRGIVAAAIASLFAFELRNVYPEEVEMLEPVVFLVIVGTVVVYGLTLFPLARRLGLADPNPQGLVILGAQAWVRQLARTLGESKFRVLLVDTNPDNVIAAKKAGLEATTADALSETVIDELDFGGIGRLLTLTPNDEINTLASLHFEEVFDSDSVYQLDARRSREERRGDQPSRFRGRHLFGRDITHGLIFERFQKGFSFALFEVTSDQTFADLNVRFGGEELLLFVIRGDNLLINTDAQQNRPILGDSVVLLVPPLLRRHEAVEAEKMKALVQDALVLDIEEPPDFSELAKRAADWYAEGVSYPSSWLANRFVELARSGIPIARGAAFPHIRVAGIEVPRLVVVRCRKGIELDRGEAIMEGEEQIATVHAIFFVLSPEDHPGRHLAVLANLASAVEDPEFITRWNSADNESDLKKLLSGG